jgi:hypothetical protein
MESRKGRDNEVGWELKSLVGPKLSERMMKRLCNIITATSDFLT